MNGEEKSIILGVVPDVWVRFADVSPSEIVENLTTEVSVRADEAFTGKAIQIIDFEASLYRGNTKVQNLTIVSIDVAAGKIRLEVEAIRAGNYEIRFTSPRVGIHNDS